MSLIVTGTIGIDTVHTPTGKAERVLGGSCTYFAAAASFFTQVRIVAVAGEDFHEDYQAVFRKFPNVDVDGLEIRKGSKTFAWGGRYLEDMNERETLFTELGVLAEKPPTPPAKYRDSQFIFLANSHPVVQLQLLESFPDRKIAVADTMNLWIDTTRGDLLKLLSKVDGLVVNDEEARLLTGKRNPFTAGKMILDLGPTFVVIKKGEHGCVLVHREGLAALPAYPSERVIDPTGAGDSFAGGMMGHLAAAHSRDRSISMAAVQQALAHGTIIASFTIESFSLDRLAQIKKPDVARRYEEFQTIVRV
ncbi:MAG: PfkB family carbohydrate kinase [Planctomycetota bacterium]|nr:PfkB family carbohydrate kinase [Planctomycetota bacterium]